MLIENNPGERPSAEKMKYYLLYLLILIYLFFNILKLIKKKNSATIGGEIIDFV